MEYPTISLPGQMVEIVCNHCKYYPINVHIQKQGNNYYYVSSLGWTYNKKCNHKCYTEPNIKKCIEYFKNPLYILLD